MKKGINQKAISFIELLKEMDVHEIKYDDLKVLIQNHLNVNDRQVQYNFIKFLISTKLVEKYLESGSTTIYSIKYDNLDRFKEDPMYWLKAANFRTQNLINRSQGVQ